MAITILLTAHPRENGVTLLYNGRPIVVPAKLERDVAALKAGDYEASVEYKPGGLQLLAITGTLAPAGPAPTFAERVTRHLERFHVDLALEELAAEPAAVDADPELLLLRADAHRRKKNLANAVSDWKAMLALLDAASLERLRTRIRTLADEFLPDAPAETGTALAKWVLLNESAAGTSEEIDGLLQPVQYEHYPIELMIRRAQALGRSSANIHARRRLLDAAVQRAPENPDVAAAMKALIADEERRRRAQPPDLDGIARLFSIAIPRALARLWSNAPATSPAEGWAFIAAGELTGEEVEKEARALAKEHFPDEKKKLPVLPFARAADGRVACLWVVDARAGNEFGVVALKKGAEPELLAATTAEFIASDAR